MRGIIGFVFLLAAAGCSDAELKTQGQACFGSTECEPGLTCDFGQSPSICAPNQTDRPVDAAPAPDIDADPNAPDADPNAPDAMPLPDATVFDAAVIDADTTDADTTDADTTDADTTDAAL